MAAACTNLLIQRMTPPVFGFLAPHFEVVELKPRDVLVRPNTRIEYVYFPQSGLISVQARAEQAETIEVGLIGNDGMTDMIPVPFTPLQTMVHVAGQALRIKHDVVAEAAKKNEALAELVFRYHQFFIVQISHTALSHGSFTVVERLARWLLMAHDRLNSGIPLTHDFFAWMLAVRRAGISEAMRALQTQGSIRLARGQIQIVDRAALQEAAAGSYGQPEVEYERLVRGLPSHR